MKPGFRVERITVFTMYCTTCRERFEGGLQFRLRPPRSARWMRLVGGCWKPVRSATGAPGDSLASSLAMPGASGARAGVLA